MATTPKNQSRKPKHEAAGGNAPAALKEDVLDRPNVIQLKPGAQVPALGGPGIRSPIAQAPAGRPVAQKGEPNASPPKVSNATPIESPRIVSKINLMSDVGHGLSGTHLGTVMYDSFGARRNRFLIALVVVVVVLVGVGAFVFPKERTKILDTIGIVKDDVVGMVRYKKKKLPRGREAADEESQFIVDAEKNVRNPRPKGPIAATGKRSCKFLIQQGVGRGVKLTLADQVDLAECYLVQDDLLNAESALEAAEVKVQRLSERELNAMKADHTLVDAYYDLLLARLRSGKTREAGELLRGRCTSWAQTNTCVAKMMLLADRRVPGGGDGAQVMFGSTGRLDAKAQARLSLAGAQLALADGRQPVADQRYAMALNSAPKAALALRKQIYEAQALDLYNRGEMIRLKSSVTAAIADLGRLSAPPKSLLKLEVFKELAVANVKTRYKTVKGILTREEITFKARADFDLIEVLGPESIRAGVEDDYLRLLKRTREFYESKYKTLGLVERRLIVWEIRATLSRERFEAALPMIDRLEKQSGPDPLSHHLRGVAFVQMADTGQQVTAIQEFQAALRLKRNWESLYALGVVLTRSGKTEQVAAIIKDLDKIITTNGQRYWVEMLKAEWYTEKGKYVNAQKILTDWQKKEATYVVPRQLLMKLYKKMGKTDAMDEVEQEIVKLSRTQRPASTFEGLSSPLGVMALARRPID